MGYSVFIKRVSDGQVALHEDGGEWVFPSHLGTGSIFWWGEGNGSCDCNRDLFFNRARGTEDQEDDTCGESRYLIRVVLPNGEVPFDEWKDGRID